MKRCAVVIALSAHETQTTASGSAIACPPSPEDAESGRHPLVDILLGIVIGQTAVQEGQERSMRLLGGLGSEAREFAGRAG